MKRSKLLTIIFMLLILTTTVNFSMTIHTVESSGFVFSPADITVEVGDTVRWMNISGNHNVVADDGSFTSGAASASNWVYDHVFTEPGENPYYCINHGGPGGSGMSGNVTVKSPSAVGDEVNSLNSFQLKQNYPNPFNPTTIIGYRISDNGFVSLKIFDALGNEVATLVDEIKPAGDYEINFNASAFGSGIYYYQLKTKDLVQTKKMILIK